MVTFSSKYITLNNFIISLKARKYSSSSFWAGGSWHEYYVTPSNDKAIEDIIGFLLGLIILIKVEIS